MYFLQSCVVIVPLYDLAVKRSYTSTFTKGFSLYFYLYRTIAHLCAFKHEA